MEYRKAKKEQAKAIRAQEKATKEAMEIKDVLWQALQNYETSQKLDLSNPLVTCAVPIPNIIENWFAKGHALSFIPYKYVETNGKLRNLSNLEYEIDSALRDVKNGFARKVIFTWTRVTPDENGKVTAENVVTAYYKGENPTLKIHFMPTIYRSARCGVSDDTADDTAETKEVIPFSFE